MTAASGTEDNTKRRARAKVSPASGFTLIEVMIASVILTTALLSLAYAFGAGLVMVNNAQGDTIARQKARETIESVVTAINTDNLQFSSVCNIGSGAGCIFLAGLTPLYKEGTDGIFGTSDDTVAGVQTMLLPGPDNLIGTADDVTVTLNNYQRQIDITSISSILTRITVTVQWTTQQGFVRKVVIRTYVSPYT